VKLKLFELKKKWYNLNIFEIKIYENLRMM